MAQRLLAVVLGPGSAALAIYVLANVVLVTFVPIVHQFTFDVVVVDGDTDDAVAGAMIADRGRTVGVTDQAGRCEFPVTIQDNPPWFWPTIGSFRYSSLPFDVSAPGFVASKVAAGEAIQGVSFRRPAATLRIRLRHRDGVDPGVRETEGGGAGFGGSSGANAGGC